jgi:hypothetical protein
MATKDTHFLSSSPRNQAPSEQQPQQDSGDKKFLIQRCHVPVDKDHGKGDYAPDKQADKRGQ